MSYTVICNDYAFSSLERAGLTGSSHCDAVQYCTPGCTQYNSNL